MAADNLTNILSALSTTFSKRLVKAWNRQAILASIIQTEDENGQGDAKQIAWDVAFSGATASAFQEGSDVAASEFNQDPFVPAVIPWGQYRAPFKLTNLEINAATKSIANATALGNIVATRLEGSLTKMVSVINADLFSGTGTDPSGFPNIVGLTSALANTGTYATISKAQYPEWAGNVLANGGNLRPLTFDLIANAEQNVFQSSGMELDCLVGSAGVIRKYEGLFEVGRRIVNMGDASVQSYQGSTTQGMTGRSTNLYWRGKPVYRDRNAPPNTLYGLNLGEVAIKPLAFNPISPDGVPVNRAQLASNNGQTATPTNIGCVVYPLARLGSAVAFVAETYVQMKVARPNAHFQISDISEN